MQDEFEALLKRQEELVPELRSCVYDEPEGWAVLKHPLYIQVMYTPALNALINQQFLLRKQKVEEARQKGDWGQFLAFHERPFRLFAFREVCDQIPDIEYWETLGWLWSDSENLFEIDFLDELLSSSRPGIEHMMDDHERQWFADLPDRVAVYRGYFYNDRKIAHSWSLAYTTAAWFAARFHKKGKIVRGEVEKEHISALILGRNEVELVTLPKYVENVRLMREPKESVSLKKFQQMAENEFVLPKTCSIHGPRHWFKVEMNGLYIADRMPDVDRLVVRLFAMFHDCKRQDELIDPEHGQRAAHFIKDNIKKFSLLSFDQKDLLIYACAWHNDGQISSDSTIGACWDADRLDLIRVNIYPDPGKLSTEVGKKSIFQV